MKHIEDSHAFVALELLNRLAVDHPSYDLLMHVVKRGVATPQTDAETLALRSFIEEVLADAETQYFEQTGEALASAIDIEEVVGLAGEGARRVWSDLAIDETGPVPIPSGYVEQANDIGWSLNNMARWVCIKASGFIPVAGPFVDIFIGLVWPEDGSTLALLQRFYGDAEFLLREALLARTLKAFQVELEIVHRDMQHYAKATSPAHKQRLFRDALRHSENTLSRFVGTDGRALSPFPFYVAGREARWTWGSTERTNALEIRPDATARHETSA